MKYVVNPETGSLWYKLPNEEDYRLIGYYDDFKTVFEKLEISIEYV